MTSLLLDRHDRTATPRGQRPLVLIATLGGAAAALAPLLVCVALGIVGWFASDAGAHGAPRDGMQMGAVAWLMAHGSGITVRGVAVGAVPLGLTLICAWSMWRMGHRVGDALSGHGPDADRISDGERDVTVPTAVAMFFIGYALVAVVVSSLLAGVETSLSVPRVVLWSLAMSLAFAGPAIAIGSGRAAIWATFVPAVIRQGAATAVVDPDGVPRRLGARVRRLPGLRHRDGRHDDGPAPPQRRRGRRLCRSPTRVSCPTRPCSPAPS